jgi:hypothetical protein
MRPSERIVFLILLERSDNADCTIPAFMTPSLAQLADATGYSMSATKEAIVHLERHGWLTRTRGGGRGHKSGYQLTDGHECQAGSPAACLRPPKQADGSAPFPEKQADGSAQKQADEPSRNGRSGPVSHVGINEGGISKGNWPPVRIPGVRGPIPEDGQTRRALHVIADILGPVEVIEIKEAK